MTYGGSTRRGSSAFGVGFALLVLLLLLAFGASIGGACKDDGPPSTDAAASDAAPSDAGLDVPDGGAGECGSGAAGTWSPIDLGLPSAGEAGVSTVNLFGVWGAVRADQTESIWAVGSGGKVLRFDGQRWSLMQTPSGAQLTSVWGTSETNVWAAGFDAVVLHYDGTQWSDVSPPVELFVSSDAGIVDRDAALARRANLWGIWVAGRENETDAVFAVGDRGAVLLWQAGGWKRVGTGGVEEDLSAVWGANAENVFAVGDFGTALKGSSAGFARQDTGIARALRGVWGRSASEVYAVGVEGTVMRFDGSAWSQVDGAPRQVLRDIWGPASDRSITYIAGWDGALVRMGGGPTFRRGATFDVIGCVTQHRLEGIWGRTVEEPAVPPGDGGVAQPDATLAPKPRAWVVGVSGTVIGGPR